MFPGGMDMQRLLEQAEQMQQRIASAQEALASERVSGSAGGGMVTATVSGTGELMDLDISPQAVDRADPDALSTLADLVVAAVRDANRAAQRLAAERMGPLAQGIGALGGIGGLPGPGV